MGRLNGSTLVLATHNSGKLVELADLLAPYGVTLLGARELGLEEPAETETSFVGNARIKAFAAARATGMTSLSDDSGLSVDGLDGAPGVYSADWAETPSGRNFDLAMARVWAELEARGVPEPRTAQFRCTLVLAEPDGKSQVFEGVMPGRIVWPGRGVLGHGYDPIFLPDGFDMTCGEMERFEKNRISHRGRALAALIKECFT